MRNGVFKGFVKLAGIGPRDSKNYGRKKQKLDETHTGTLDGFVKYVQHSIQVNASPSYEGFLKFLGGGNGDGKTLINAAYVKQLYSAERSIFKETGKPFTDVELQRRVLARVLSEEIPFAMQYMSHANKPDADIRLHFGSDGSREFTVTLPKLGADRETYTTLLSIGARIFSSIPKSSGYSKMTHEAIGRLGEHVKPGK